MHRVDVRGDHSRCWVQLFLLRNYEYLSEKKQLIVLLLFTSSGRLVTFSKLFSAFLYLTYNRSCRILNLRTHINCDLRRPPSSVMLLFIFALASISLVDSI